MLLSTSTSDVEPLRAEVKIAKLFVSFAIYLGVTLVYLESKTARSMLTYGWQVERCLAQRAMEKKLILSSPVTGPNGNNECFNAVFPSTAGLFSRSARRVLSLRGGTATGLMGRWRTNTSGLCGGEAAAAR